jgi:hypothetical protein
MCVYHVGKLLYLKCSNNQSHKNKGRGGIEEVVTKDVGIGEGGFEGTTLCFSFA